MNIEIDTPMILEPIKKTLKPFFSISEANPRPSITYLFWRAEHFHHFYYLYNLARDCKYRVEKLKQSKDLANRMPEDVAIKIGIVGNFTEDNVKLISKRSGSALSLNAFIMKKKPILFQVQHTFSVKREK